MQIHLYITKLEGGINKKIRLVPNKYKKENTNNKLNQLENI